MLAEDPVAERVQRPRPGLEAEQARLELALRLLVVGNGEQALAVVAAIAEQMADPLGQHPRLAGPGRSDDADRAAVVEHGSGLVGGEVDALAVAGGCAHGPEAARLDRARMNDGRAVTRIRGAPAGTAVDPGATAVGQADIPLPRSLDRADAGGLRRPPPDRLSRVVAGVVVVRPDEMVEPLERQVEPRIERVGRLVEDRGVAEAGRVDGELDDYRCARQPQSPQLGNEVDGCGAAGLEVLGPDPDARRRAPRIRRRAALGDEHATPEPGRSRRGRAQRRGSRPVSSR